MILAGVQWPQQYWPEIMPSEPSDTADDRNAAFSTDWTGTVPDHFPNITAPIAIRDANIYLPDTSAPTTSRHVQRRTQTPANKAPRRRLNEAERYNTLLADEYVLWFTPTEVTCGGCLSTIQLEKRDGARYYLGRWARHKAACKGVKAGITTARRREAEAGMEPQPPFELELEGFPQAPLFLQQQF